MSASAQKFSINVISQNDEEYNSQPIIIPNGKQIPVTPHTKNIGTTYDRGMTFKAHITDLIKRSKSRLKELKASTTKNFGQQK